MDSTLQGALIGAGATLTAVIVAGLVNYLATQRQENKMIRLQKKEELYSHSLDISAFVYDLWLSRDINEKEPINLAKKIKSDVNNRGLKLKIISRLYYPEIDGVDLINSLTHTNHLLKDLSEGKTLSDDRYTDTMKHLNIMSEKISKITP